MATSIELRQPQAVWEAPAATPLDEAVWQAWVAKGRAQDRRTNASRKRAAKWVLIAAVPVAVGLWFYFGGAQ